MITLIIIAGSVSKKKKKHTKKRSKESSESYEEEKHTPRVEQETLLDDSPKGFNEETQSSFDDRPDSRPEDRPNSRPDSRPDSEPDSEGELRPASSNADSTVNNALPKHQTNKPVTPKHSRSKREDKHVAPGNDLRYVV